MFQTLVDRVDTRNIFLAQQSCDCDEDSLEDFADEVDEALETYEIDENAEED